MLKEIYLESYRHRDNSCFFVNFFIDCLQAMVVTTLYPNKKYDDIYENYNEREPFPDTKYETNKEYKTYGFYRFLEDEERNENNPFHDAFKKMQAHMRFINTKSAHTNELGQQKQFELETIKFEPKYKSENKPGKGKHIIYLLAANTHYASFYNDISEEVNETGATVHTFSHPGTAASQGKVKEYNDLLNASISMVYNLINNQKIAPEDIILQGYCFSSSIAYDTKRFFKKNHNINFQVILNSGFTSFTDAIYDEISNYFCFFPDLIKKLINSILQITGWFICIGKSINGCNDYFKGITPFEMNLIHENDKTITNSCLSKVIENNIETLDSNQDIYFLNKNNRLSILPKYIENSDDETIPEQKKEKISDKKFNSHFTKLYKLGVNGKNTYASLINKFLLLDKKVSNTRNSISSKRHYKSLR